MFPTWKMKLLNALNHKRRSWPEHAMALAIEASKRSEDPYRKVGACALGLDNRVLGVSYNGLVSNKTVNKKFWQNRDVRRPYVIHAEQNLLSLFGRNQANLIAVTLFPCEYCAKLIATWGIPKVYYIDEYERMNESKNILKFYNIKYYKLYRKLL